MDFNSYGITQTTKFIHTGNVTTVALQFPDDLLKDSIKFLCELRKEHNLITSDDRKEIELDVLADTTYGSCCVDEDSSMHALAEQFLTLRVIGARIYCLCCL
ncbi:hypothetical protein MKX01_028123 [Papaver californicum]|nr:hypothetical protein MKX01_028123 [Papaver californicum]